MKLLTVRKSPFLSLFVHMKNYIIIITLFLIQWSSITVIILNSLALTAIESLESQGYIMINSQEFVLIILGVISLLLSSILLCFYIQLCLNAIQSKPNTTPSKRLLACQMAISLFLTCLWMSFNIIIMTHFKGKQYRVTEMFILTHSRVFDLQESYKFTDCKESNYCMQPS